MSVGFRIVCLCGSAGALSAYIDILREMPIDTGMAFLVLTHRRGGRPCWLPEIIARSTRMSVQQGRRWNGLHPQSYLRHAARHFHDYRRQRTLA